MELPQINPDIGVQPQRVVGSIGAAGAGMGEAAEAFKEVDRQASLLMNWQARQARIQHFTDGDADYIIGSAKAFANARGIQDPNVRMKALTDTLSDLKTQIIKEHPLAADKLNEQLGVRFADDIKKAELQNIELSDRNLKANLALIKDKTVVAASTATDPRDRAVALNNYQGFLNSQMQTGMMVPAETEKEMFDMKYELAKADYGILAAHRPDLALQVPLEDTGLKENDYFTTRFRASAELNRSNNTAEQEWKGEKNAAQEKVMGGDYRTLEEDYKAGKIPIDMYKGATGHFPSNPDSVNTYNQTIDNWSGSADELLDFGVKNIATNSALEPFDRNATMGRLRNMARELRTNEGYNAQMLVANAKLDAIKKHPEYYMSLSNPLASNAKLLNQKIDMFRLSLKGLKPEAQLNAYNAFTATIGADSAEVAPRAPAPLPPDPPMGY